MYSMFNLFFRITAYRHIYVISDGEMNELKRTKIMMNLKKFVIKRKDLKKYTKLNSNISMKEKKS